MGRTNIITKALFDKYEVIVTGSHVTIIRLIKNMCVPLFIYYFLKSPVIFDQVEEKINRSTNQIELFAKTIMSYAVPISPQKKDKIVNKINSLFECINSYITYIFVLIHLYQLFIFKSFQFLNLMYLYYNI